MQILKSIYFFLVDTVQTFALALAVFLIVYFFVARPFQVSGESMYPTYKDHEYIFTNIIGLRISELKRGDVIVFKSPMDQKRDFIKRVIGVPGDTITLVDGKVYLNNQILDESEYLSNDINTFSGRFLQDGETVQVPTGSIFVMGDNRTNSSDSREWGFLEKSEVIGKSFFVYWPISQARAIENPYK